MSPTSFVRACFTRTRSGPGVRQIFVVGWTGMRGVIALAAAMSLPQTVADGSPFPHRDLIVFLTFCVILVTLVLQGLTLPSLIREIGSGGNTAQNAKKQEARRLVLQASCSRILEDIRQKRLQPDSADVYDDLAQHYKHRLASVSGLSHGSKRSPTPSITSDIWIFPAHCWRLNATRLCAFGTKAASPTKRCGSWSASWI